MPRRYIFKDGALHERREHTSGMLLEKYYQYDESNRLAIVSSIDEAEHASIAIERDTGINMECRLAESVTAARRTMRSPEYCREFVSGVPHERMHLFEEICQYFEQYNIPIGLLDKLLALRNYHLNFIIGDNASMTDDVENTLATGHQRDHGDNSSGSESDEEAPMPRWRETQNKLHIFVDLLAFIPVRSISIRFMRCPRVVTLSPRGRPPSEFMREAHSTIASAFRAVEREGGLLSTSCPVLTALQESIGHTQHLHEPTSHYVLGATLPTDASLEKLRSFVWERSDSSHTPLTFISCVGEHSSGCDWMRDVGRKALLEEDEGDVVLKMRGVDPLSFTNEIASYEEEKERVLRFEGPAFPYTRGFWLVSHLVASLNPDDINAMYEDLPFSKYTLDELLGRIHTTKEYDIYFYNNPRSKFYVDLHKKFADSSNYLHARDIVPLLERAQRREDGCTVM